MAEFDKPIKDKKIIHHFGCFYTLQEQKQIEKFNRTLKNYLAQYFQKYNTNVWVLCQYFWLIIIIENTQQLKKYLTLFST
jgi:hypothetical protein